MKVAGDVAEARQTGDGEGRPPPYHAPVRRLMVTRGGSILVITFLISALGHEIIMACITKKLRGYGFVCQMMQLPIVAVQRTKFVRGRKTLNNVMFWCSMILGLSLVSSPMSLSLPYPTMGCMSSYTY